MAKERKALEISCDTADCSRGLHCFRATKEMAAKNQAGVCRECGADLIDWPRVHQCDLQDINYTTPEQVSRLVQVARGEDWEGAILVGYTTGMRLQDVANLRWSSVDVKNGLLSFVQRKGDKPAVSGCTRI